MKKMYNNNNLDFFDTEVEIKKNINLKNYNTLKLTSIADLYIVKSLESLVLLIKYFYKNNIEYLILGSGSNIVLSEKYYQKIIKLDFKEDKFYLKNKLSQTQLNNKQIRFSASISLKKLTSLAIAYSLSGWEVLTGIPASLGGAVFMNAGTKYGDISSLVESVEVINKKGNIILYKRNDLSFAYRKNLFLKDGEIITHVTLKFNEIDASVQNKIKKYLQLRFETQPLNAYTAGCTYKNNLSKKISAGQAIDLLGLKGFSYRNLQISMKHANFIENKKDSKKDDLIMLLDVIDKQINSIFNINLTKEIILY